MLLNLLDRSSQIGSQATAQVWIHLPTLPDKLDFRGSSGSGHWAALKNLGSAARVVAPRPCHKVCLDQDRPVYPQVGLYAGMMVPCDRTQMSLGRGEGGLSQLGDDLK